MFGIGKHGPDGKYAIILDIGSASAAAAIVASDVVTKENPIIFTHREWGILKDANSDKPTRFIEEALLRLFLVLNNTGFAALKKYDPLAKISHIQCAISAPWAHTVTQQAEYESDTDFVITNKLIKQLIAKAQEQSLRTVETSQFLEKNNVEIITNQTLHIVANGYAIDDPRNLEARKLYISHSCGIAASAIVEGIKNHTEKVLPEIPLVLNTFILSYYLAIRDIFPNTSDMALVDITGEATEVGIVRNNELVTVSHVLTGMQTLTRILAETLKIPQATARTFLQNDPPVLSESQKKIVEKVTEEYVEEIKDLFTSMGDILTIPNSIYLHSDSYTEDFFKKHITKAAQRSTSGQHTLVPVSKSMFPDSPVTDTAILLSSYVFHTLHKQGTLAKS